MSSYDPHEDLGDSAGNHETLNVTSLRQEKSLWLMSVILQMFRNLHLSCTTQILYETPVRVSSEFRISVLKLW